MTRVVDTSVWDGGEVGVKKWFPGLKIVKILRDGIASGRGVHRKMGVLIQKSRSNFGVKVGKSPKFGILGVGVV